MPEPKTPYRAEVPWLPRHIARRNRQPEWMDDAALSPRMHAEALRGLARLNALSRTTALGLAAINRVADTTKLPIRVLDLGCGDGALLADLHRASQGRITGTGLDISPTAIAAANARSTRDLCFQQADLLADKAWPVSGRHDVAMLSLFLHHLDEANAVALLCRAAAHTKRGIVVLDLQRSWPAWWAIRMAALATTRSPVVHVDSALSVQAGFTPRELAAIARRAKLGRPRIRVAFPFRLVMEWRKPEWNAAGSAPG